ncbi:CPBP family glutamic-type intramembrane protease [Lysobacter sp. HA35]
MKWCYGLRLVAAVLLMGTNTAWAAVDAPPTPEAGVQQVEAKKLSEYRAVLATFDRASAAAPTDVDLALDRCRFIDQFTDDESGTWIESAVDDFDQCQSDVETRWSSAPAVQLFAMQRLWGKEAVERGEALSKQAATWPPALRRDLYAKLSSAYASQHDTKRAGELALQAVQLGDEEHVAPAIDYLVEHKRYAEAERLLTSAPPAKGSWSAERRITAALALPDHRAALRELGRYHAPDDAVSPDIAARAYLRAGDARAAKRELDKAEGDYASVQQARFDTAIALGDARTAAAAVHFADVQNIRTATQRFATLAHAMPSSLLRPSMWPGVLGVALLVALIALLPGLVLVPAHYRGLMRRLNGRAGIAVFPSGLRRAWIAAALFLIVPLLAALVVAPKGFLDLSAVGPDAERAMFRTVFVGMLASLLCLLPLARGIPRVQLFGDRAAWRAARWRVPAAWALAFGTGAAIGVWHAAMGGGAPTAQTRAVEALAAGGMQAYGLPLTLLVMAVLAPIVEEFVFRGMLLGGLSRHISFGWANTVQAAAFALGHGDPPRFLFYFVLGLASGWLVKRTGSIGPSIALHALNNALAALLITSTFPT